MSKKVYVLLAEGFELIEAMTPVDVLRRSGAEVITVSISDEKEVISAQKVTIKSDITLAERDITDGDMLVIPGGYPGYINLRNSEKVANLVKYYVENDKYIGAICGGPTVLSTNGILKGKKVTCHSSVVAEMDNYTCTGTNVEKDGKLITGVGAGLSLNFAFALAEVLFDEEVITKVKTGMELI